MWQYNYYRLAWQLRSMPMRWFSSTKLGVVSRNKIFECLFSVNNYCDLSSFPFFFLGRCLGHCWVLATLVSDSMNNTCSCWRVKWLFFETGLWVLEEREKAQQSTRYLHDHILFHVWIPYSLNSISLQVQYLFLLHNALQCQCNIH